MILLVFLSSFTDFQNYVYNGLRPKLRLCAVQSFFRCLHFAHFVFLTKLLCVLWLELDQWCQQQRKFQWTWSKVLRIFVANSQTWKGEMMWRRGLGYTLYILHILICTFWFVIYSIYSTSWISLFAYFAKCHYHHQNNDIVFN